MNIVSDMGQVLLRFEPEQIARHFVPPEDVELFAAKVFRSSCWNSLDRGTLTLPQACQILQFTLPERLHSHLDRALEDWFRFLPPIEGMEPLLRELHSQGHHLYLLSNASQQYHQYLNTVPAWDCFDGFLISADWKLLKPEPAIYLALAETCHLSLEECLFVDDREENVAGAQAVGMEGILFTDAQSLRSALSLRGLL